ncbi:MAG: hypothetical protein HYV63_10020 [Candidatus Schekmanbacteria bacterium]|nr:hypothetical protein [Candidatus Schekmanbacteria bacterium]
MPLVVLPPTRGFIKLMPRDVEDAIHDYLCSHGNQPRHRANRLLFVAPDHAVLSRLRDATRTALAWASIVDDVDKGTLNIDQAQKRQAQQEAKSAADALPAVLRECYKWLLCPSQEDPTATKSTVEAFPIGIVGGRPSRQWPGGPDDTDPLAFTHARTEGEGALGRWEFWPRSRRVFRGTASRISPGRQQPNGRTVRKLR